MGLAGHLLTPLEWTPGSPGMGSLTAAGVFEAFAQGSGDPLLQGTLLFWFASEGQHKNRIYTLQ